MRIKFEVTTIIYLDLIEGMKPLLRQTDVHLDVSKNIQREAYFNKKKLPNLDGHRAITNCLVCGISNNIHAAHQAGLWDSAAHLRYIIDELQRHFVEVADAKEADFKPLDEQNKQEDHEQH